MSRNWLSPKSRHDVSSSKVTAPDTPELPRKKAVWRLNLVSMLPLLLGLALSATDPITRGVTSVSLVISLGAAYFSVRTRINFIGFLLLLVTAYVNVVFLVSLLRKA